MSPIPLCQASTQHRIPWGGVEEEGQALMSRPSQGRGDGEVEGGEVDGARLVQKQVRVVVGLWMWR